MTEDEEFKVVYGGSEVYRKAMADYYKVFDRIRKEQDTWYPAPDLLITKLLNLTLQGIFGETIKWQYDNAPESLGDFACEEPDGRYDYDRYHETITLKILNASKNISIEGYNPRTKLYRIPNAWLWDVQNRPIQYFRTLNARKDIPLLDFELTLPDRSEYYVAKDATGQWWAYDTKPHLLKEKGCWDYLGDRPDKLDLKGDPVGWDISLRFVPMYHGLRKNDFTLRTRNIQKKEA